MGPFINPLIFFRQAKNGSIIRTMKDPRTNPQFKIRLTPELKSQLEAASLESGRTMTTEIIHRLEGSFAMDRTIGDLPDHPPGSEKDSASMFMLLEGIETLLKKIKNSPKVEISIANGDDVQKTEDKGEQ